MFADSVSQAKKSPGLTRSALVQSHRPKQLSLSDASLKLMQSYLWSLNCLRSYATFCVTFCMSFPSSSGLPLYRIISDTSVFDAFCLTSFLRTVTSSCSSSVYYLSFEWSTFDSMKSLNSFFSSLSLLIYVSIFARCSFTCTMFWQLSAYLVVTATDRFS